MALRTQQGDLLNTNTSKNRKDILLFEQLRQGNNRALDELFGKYYESLCKFCRFFVESREDTEEIVTDVFVEIWRKRREIKVKKSLEAYLYTSVKHKAFAFLSSQQKRAEGYDESQFNRYHTSQNPESEALFNELSSEVNLIINSLPEPGKTIFRLRKIDGLSYREITKIMNVSEKTVENHLVIVLKKLRQTIHGYEYV